MTNDTRRGTDDEPRTLTSIESRRCDVRVELLLESALEPVLADPDPRVAATAQEEAER
jgi:hypothetical protein